MKIKLCFIILGFLTFLSCDPEPTGPEMDCNLLPLYELDYHSLKAAGVFDVRTTPPAEIKDGALEYKLTYQWVFLKMKDPMPYPYSEYFIDSIEFTGPSTVDVGILDSDHTRTYDFTRDDCQLELESQEGKLHLELTEGGAEIAETRFAIYDHKSKRVNIDNMSFISDTFLFLEFRLGPFSSYEEIIKQFALENPGLYDTIAVEQVVNRTRE